MVVSIIVFDVVTFVIVVLMNMPGMSLKSTRNRNDSFLVLASIFISGGLKFDQIRYLKGTLSRV